MDATAMEFLEAPGAPDAPEARTLPDVVAERRERSSYLRGFAQGAGYRGFGELLSWDPLKAQAALECYDQPLEVS